MQSRIIFGCLLFPLLVACHRGETGRRQVFRYSQPDGISTLDPAFSKSQAINWATHQLYNSLTEVDRNLNIVPALARSWRLSQDRLEYTFILRNDVMFHDHPAFQGGRGRRMTAADVAYSLSRIIDPKTASPGAWIFNGRVDSLRPFHAPDDTTFIIRLQRPFPPILGILGMMYCSVVPHEGFQ